MTSIYHKSEFALGSSTLKICIVQLWHQIIQNNGRGLLVLLCSAASPSKSRETTLFTIPPSFVTCKNSNLKTLFPWPIQLVNRIPRIRRLPIRSILCAAGTTDKCCLLPLPWELSRPLYAVFLRMCFHRFPQPLGSSEPIPTVVLAWLSWDATCIIGAWSKCSAVTFSPFSVVNRCHPLCFNTEFGTNTDRVQ